MDTEKLDNKENKAKEKDLELEYDQQNYIKYLLDYSSNFQIILDGEGKIRRVNQTFEEIAGKKKEELIGSFIYEFIPEEIIK
ncbi:MAG: PAS domain-containing protein, partial [Candidatus Atribacteria bacterium]|nr:PAS domain-containing protein [Candidatus Atribacteria bacterium]